MSLLAVIVSAPAPATVQGSRGVFNFPLRMLNGMETMRLDADRIGAYRGSATDNSGRFLLYTERSIIADILKVGPGGRDNALTREDLAQHENETDGLNAVYAVGQRFSGLPLAGWYTPVYIGKSKEGKNGLEATAQLILTRHQSSQRINRPDSLNIDPTFDARRSAPIAYYFDPATGFRPMICKGWPQPFCIWTRTNYGPLYVAREIVGDDTLLDIDATDMVPPTGRLLRLQVSATSTGGTGDVMIMTLPRESSGLNVVTVARQGDVVRAEIEFSVNSQRHFTMRVPRGVRVDLIALGFSMLQPT
ncbi:hypothetical protein [Mesorhizobium shangrilense]|uniref:DUF2460 domain-containing protein n=1 Tax=Mesorhizobium shangrilense TaxID=460060 RepID=A0ABV2DQ09_9HYPH